MRTNNLHLRMSGKQHEALMKHLLPEDGKEAAAIALCGRLTGKNKTCIMIRKLVLVPYDTCRARENDLLIWPTDLLIPLLEEAEACGGGILKLHSHPGGWEDFSILDDKADRSFFGSVYSWLDTDDPHASVILLPDGRLIGRVVDVSGNFTPLASISVAGDDINIWRVSSNFKPTTGQLFARGTRDLLSELTIGVVGCSGTGSFVVELLARQGVGGLVLVDPDRVEERNLNRIINSTLQDAQDNRLKVDVAADAVDRIGFGTDVKTFPHLLGEAGTIEALSECDIVVGCVDSHSGRHTLNRLATYYSIPYFDVGVRIDPDGKGGVESVWGAIHYLQPGGSSVLSRGAVSMEGVRAESLKQSDPAGYEEQRRAGYIIGVKEEQLAVVSANAYFASKLLNEILARLHPFRDEPNSNYAQQRFNLAQNEEFLDPYDEPCEALLRYVGRGDVVPLLGLAGLSRAA
ncbi:MAG: ThiF family adenylyltransferase [Calditrichia bacterium]